MKSGKDWFGDRKRPHWTVSLQQNGFLLADEQTQIRLTWKSIVKIIAFKLDRVTTDLICLSIETEDGKAVVVTEEDNGFSEWEQSLPINLDGFISDWRRQVVLPAFDTSATVIYARSVGA